MSEKRFDLYCYSESIIQDAIDQIVVKIHNYNVLNDKKSIMITGCSTNCGVTTTAISLAIALSQTNQKTLLIDCDLRKGNKYKRLNDEKHIGLADYLLGINELDDIVNATNYDNLSYLPCGYMHESPIRLLCSDRMRLLLNELYELYDYIIIDMPSINVVADANTILPYLDGVMLVAALELTTKKQLRDGKRQVNKYMDKYYGVIINKVERHEYSRYVKDYDYFASKKMEKRHKKQVKKSNKIKRLLTKGGSITHE